MIINVKSVSWAVTTVTYGAETWGMRMDARHTIDVIEMKFLRIDQDG